MDLHLPPGPPLELDDHMLDALLAGTVHPDDAPPGYAGVALVLLAADAPVREDETVRAPDSIRRIFAEARQGPPPPVVAPERSRAMSRAFKAVVAAIGASLVLGGGVAMAATGSLPDPVQSAAHTVLGAVGIEVPEPAASEPAPPAPEDDRGGQPGDDDAATTTTASTAPAPTTTTELAAIDPTATTAPGEVVPAGGPGVVPGQGPEVCELASDGKCKAGEEHPSATNPQATVTTVVPTTPAPTTQPGPVGPDEVPGKGDETCTIKSDGKCKAAEEHPSATNPGKGQTVVDPGADTTSGSAG